MDNGKLIIDNGQLTIGGGRSELRLHRSYKDFDY